MVIGHWSFGIFFLSFVILFLSACAHPDAAWDRVLETGVLRVGMDASFPPFETIAADGTLIGFDVDLARELGQRLGIEVQFVANLPYDGLYDALAVDRVDAVISALVIDPARMADFAYSTPYFDAGQVLVVWVGGTDSEWQVPVPVETMADMGGRRLAVEFGTQGDLEARKWARRVSGLTVVPYQTAAEAVAGVVAGEVDAALVDHVSALAAGAWPEGQVGARADGAPGYRAGGGLIVAGTPVVEEPYAVAVRRESRHLLRSINEALSEMQADGTLEMLTAQWLEK